LAPAPALRREEIKLQVALITPLLHVKGYAAPESKAAAERANLLIEQATALGEPLEDPLLLYSVLYGVWVANYIAFNGDAMRELAAQFLLLAEKQGSVVPVVVAQRIMAVSLLCTGDILQARVHSDRAAALHNPAEHRPVATRFGQDNGVAILAYRSLGSWLLGYPAASLAEVESAVRAAREIGQAATLMFVLTHAALTHLVSRNYVEAKGEAEELAAVAGDKEASFWKAIGTMAQGWVFALTGKASDAVDLLTSGIGAFRSTGSTLWMPLHMSCMAIAFRDLNRFDEAWRCISEAMSAIETTGERWYEAEVLRVGGAIAIMSPERDTAKAEMFFDRALGVAREQRAKSWELRAATSMARLWHGQGKRQQARDLLAPVYGWFTEGFDTLDLKEAKALLDALAS
jgi:predicted ATPase